MEKNLYDRLTEYVDGGFIPFHMPGHKRNEQADILGVNHYDITEIDGFDNYHHATDILKDEFEYAAGCYESDKSYYLVNGCSVGILAAVSASVKRGGRILIGRNCHKAVYNAIYLNELSATYIYPDMADEIDIYTSTSPESISKALEDNEDIQAVLITSPTYEGIVSDIKSIAKIVHKYNIPLIVDGAHGAHFYYDTYFPENALKCGADIVIEGLHKTMPSLTQTAIMHVKSELVDIQKLDRYVSMYQTTSPSYVFMASISKCIHSVFENRISLFEGYSYLLENTRKRLSELKKLRLYYPKHNEMYDYDKSKLVIYTGECNITGNELHKRLLEEYKIQCEMSSTDYIILMTSMYDSKENMDRLCVALGKIDEELERTATKKYDITFVKPDIKTNSYEAMNSQQTTCPIRESVGKVAAEYIYVYPPGIPIIVPGEISDENVIDIINIYIANGLEVIGLNKENVQVVAGGIDG